MSTDTWFTFFAILTVAANVATLSLWGLALAANASDGARQWWQSVRLTLHETGLAITAIVASVATAGSLYLSEGAHLLPCKLCWYQRSAMYPLAVVLVVAAVRRDWAVRPYALALSLIGPVISIYHYVIERSPDLELGDSCDPTNPCTLTLVWKFHYISIPFMALSAFLLVATVLLAAKAPDPAAAVLGTRRWRPMSNQRTRNRAPGTPAASPFRISTAVVVGIVVAVVGIAVVLALVLGGDDSGDDGGVDQTRPVTVQGTALGPPDASGTVDPAVGEAAPVLEGENFAGEKVTIGDDGRAKAIFFVAHWCPHCQAEVPIVSQYLDDPGLPDGVDLYIVPTSTDKDLPNYPPSTWLDEAGVGDVPTLVDDDQSTAHAAYGNGNFPNLVLVGADGNVAARFSGELGADAYPQLFDALAAGDPIPGAVPGPSSNTPA